MTNSRDKGKRGEREARDVWTRVMGSPARRGQQFSGGPDSPDIITEYTELHPEVKYQEKMRLYEWIGQAIHDAKGKLPFVMHRQSRKPWLFTILFEDLPRLAHILHEHGLCTRLSEDVSQEEGTEEGTAHCGADESE